MLKLQKLNKSGDTIVEVMLSLLVVGLALGLAYGVASRSLKLNRQSQERVEALKQVESQVERLKKAVETDPGDGTGIFRTSPYCLTEGSATPQPIGSAPPESLNDDSLSDDNYNNCKDVIYYISISPDNLVPAGTKQFHIRARWNSLGNISKEETVVTYRLYPEENN